MAVEKVGFDDSLVKRISCKNCAAILSYLPKDVKSHLMYFRGECEGTFYFIDCPSCKSRVEIRRTS